MNKLTVVCGAGFIGTNLCKPLKKNNFVFEIIDLKKSQSFPKQSKIGDVRDINSLRHTITGNTIINLAAVHRDDIKNKREYHETNVFGADNIVKICIEKNLQDHFHKLSRRLWFSK